MKRTFKKIILYMILPFAFVTGISNANAVLLSIDSIPKKVKFKRISGSEINLMKLEREHKEHVKMMTELISDRGELIMSSIRFHELICREQIKEQVREIKKEWKEVENGNI